MAVKIRFVVCCVLLFSIFEALVRAPRELVGRLNLQGGHILTDILAFVSASQTIPRTANMGVIYYLGLLRPAR